MSRTIKLGLAQFNPVVGDITGNVKRICQIIEEAKIHSVDLLAFPELSVTGYPPEDLLYQESFIQSNLNAIDRILEVTHNICVIVGFVAKEDSLFNASAVMKNKEILDTYYKHILPNYGVFDEQRYFSEGQDEFVFTVNDVCVGTNICEDIWFPEGPTKNQKNKGAECIININASPFHTEKKVMREVELASRAKENDIPIAYVNMVGGQDELVFDGNSFIVNNRGNVITRASSFEEELITVDMVFENSVVDIPKPAKVYDINNYPNSREPRNPMEVNGLEEVYRALVLGTKDYAHKSGFNKVLLGLSGGIDSALTAIIAADALGNSNVTAVTMPSRYSSRGSVEDSEILARNIGIELLNVPIEKAHLAFENLLNPIFAGTKENLAEENVQSRIRGNILMTISNKFGWLVLTTGNKSEMSMGYATLYGDMAGGFCIIKDIPKTLVYKLCEWKNETLGYDAIPRNILEKPPSAELKPDQIDQDSLPPYEILDDIIELYLEKGFTYSELLTKGFSAIDVEQVIGSIHKNEYKRNQAPPGVKVTSRAFGKDWRMPIVSRFDYKEGCN
ncbi:MAG: NAD+ synthase [SAR202 cluster bacterium]|nr:NAD+ synthase [SAR202 cluster bacterium]